MPSSQMHALKTSRYYAYAGFSFGYVAAFPILQAVSFCSQATGDSTSSVLLRKVNPALWLLLFSNIRLTCSHSTTQRMCWGEAEMRNTHFPLPLVPTTDVYIPMKSLQSTNNLSSAKVKFWHKNMWLISMCTRKVQ